MRLSESNIRVSFILKIIVVRHKNQKVNGQNLTTREAC